MPYFRNIIITPNIYQYDLHSVLLSNPAALCFSKWSFRLMIEICYVKWDLNFTSLSTSHCEKNLQQIDQYFIGQWLALQHCTQWGTVFWGTMYNVFCAGPYGKYSEKVQSDCTWEAQCDCTFTVQNYSIFNSAECRGAEYHIVAVLSLIVKKIEPII
jgi:hypothetical protein